MRNVFFNKLISAGVTPELSRDEIKRVKLTNGFAVIVGIFTLLGLIAGTISVFIVTGNIPFSIIKMAILALISDLITWSIIFLTYKRLYLLSRVILIIQLWILYTALSLYYGIDIRGDHYLIGLILLPGGLFLKKVHVYIFTLITALMVIVINFYYQFYPPLMVFPEEVISFRYLIHLSIAILAITALSLYYRNQNDNSEAELLKEINQHKETTEELLQANADKDKFFSIIAHDLKGPIGNIANFLNIIDIKDIKPELLFHLQISAQNTFELTQDLLTWAQAQKNQIELQPTNFDIQKQFKSILAPLQYSADQKDIQFQILNDEKEVFIFSDIPSIKTVIRNLVSNAIKFTNKGGVIKLSSHLVNGKVKIEVSDTGIGISDDNLSKLFKVGSTITSPGTMDERGTGLGLLLCKEFVELNNGKIGVESELNKGSTFWFTLPIGKAVDLGLILESIKKKQLKTLIVEDNFLNLENTITKVTKANVIYDIARDGKDAIYKASNSAYDLILMDIDLPKLNGIEANKIIRNKNPNVIIIALSSYNKSEIMQKDKNVYFDDFLKKPLNFDNMIYTLEKLFVDQKYATQHAI